MQNDQSEHANLGVVFQPRKPFGRSHTDFQTEATESRFLPAEEELIRRISRGEHCKVSSLDWRQPEEFERLLLDATYRIRADFLRFLALGGDDACPVHEHGVSLEGAFVDGTLDLRSCKNIVPLSLMSCVVSETLNASESTAVRLALSGTRVAGIEASNAQFSGDVRLNERFKAEGGVNLNGTTIGGDLDCSAGSFMNPDDDALSAYGSKIGRNVVMTEGFKAEGEVDLHGTIIEGVLICSGGTFRNGGGIALTCQGAEIKSNAFLDDGFSANGLVSFVNAKMGQDFFCDGGSFQNSSRSAVNDDDEQDAPDALNLAGANIRGALRLTDGLGAQAKFSGSLNLHNASAGRLFDHPDSWPPYSVLVKVHGRLRCAIKLDGFQYGSLAGDGAYDAATRLRWLGRMPAAHRTKNLRPRPYEKLAQVLRAGGREDDARAILYAKQRLLARARFRQSSWLEWPFLAVTTGLFGLLAGYGYRQSRLIMILLALWMGPALFYNAAAKQGVFVPLDAEIWLSDQMTACWSPPINWTTCRKPKIAALPSFDPWLYSADVMVPFIDLKQRSSWVPMLRSFDIQVPLVGAVHIPPWASRNMMVFENVAGALGILLLGVILSGILKQD